MSHLKKTLTAASILAMASSVNIERPRRQRKWPSMFDDEQKKERKKKNKAAKKARRKQRK